jgi:hypothetical protein
VPGNFDTYFVGNGTNDFTVVRDGKTYHNTFINSSVAGGFIGRTVATLLAATQSAFFDSRLVITAGIRGDRIRFDQHGDTRLSANDPDVRAGLAIQNTVKFTAEVVDQTEFKPITSTLGGVFHATKVFSVFYNHANNNAQPPLNARVLPDEKLPPPFDGLSDDAGFMLNLLDGKVFLRATAFQTSQKQSSGGTFGIGLNSGENNLVAPSTRILDTLLAVLVVGPQASLVPLGEQPLEAIERFTRLVPQPHLVDAVLVRVALVVREEVDRPVTVAKQVPRLRVARLEKPPPTEHLGLGSVSDPGTRGPRDGHPRDDSHRDPLPRLLNGAYEKRFRFTGHGARRRGALRAGGRSLRQAVSSCRASQADVLLMSAGPRIRRIERLPRLEVRP